MFQGDTKSHPGLAAVLSFIFNGLGQIYNGEIFKGLLIIFFSIVAMLIFIFGSILIALWFWGKVILKQELFLGITLFLIGLIFICILGIYSIYDAFYVAKKK